MASRAAAGDAVAAVAAAAADDPSAQQLARDAKQRRATLKALLDDAHAQPGAAAIDYARRECRHAYLKLLFACTFSSRAHGADAAIWSETTHPLVHLFRSRLAVYEKAFKASSAARGGKDAAAGAEPAPPPPKPAAAGVRTAKQAQAQQAQAYLRLATAFRDFLLAEENFWRDLAGRVVRVFQLDEARPNLRALGIPCDADADSSFASDTSASTGLDRIPGAGAAGALPDAALLQAASLPGNRTRLLEVVHKALLCCGDLARYRELYRDDRGGGSDDGRGGAGGKRGGGAAARGRAGKVIAAAAVARTSKEVSSRRDFSRAAACYEQARLLLPDNGNPSNQLAVIATYSGDPFLSIYHYYRALCVRVPFDTARQNLELTLRKAVAAWTKEGGRERLLAGAAPEKQEEETAAAVLRHFVVLHGLFYTREKFAVIQPFAEHFLARFSSAIVNRTLGADVIVRIVVTGLAASWTARLWRSGASATTSSRPRAGRGGDATSEAAPSLGSSASAEHQHLSHVLGIMQRLVEVGTSETREALDAARKSPPTAPARMRGGAGEAAASAARHISAPFRRMLPALRILSKWMKSHLEYMSRSADRAAALSQESELSQELNATELEEAQARALADAALVQTTCELWRSYVAFVNTLRFAFPFDALPSLGAMGQTGAAPLALEEDSDMRGFAPTRKAMLYVNGSTPASSLAQPQPRISQVHPNEEQLMRIADLLIDAKVMAESDASPIYFDDERNLFALDEQGPGLNATQDWLHGTGAAESHSAEPQSSLDRIGLRDALLQRDDDPEIASESTEDVVDLAMRAGVGELDDSDDDLILIPSAASRAPAAPAAAQPQDPGTPAAARGRALAPASGASTPSPMTAQHLLLQVLTGRSPAQSPAQPLAPPPLQAPSHGSSQGAAAPPPHLLFGGLAGASDFGGAGSASIWASGPGDVHHAHARAFSPPARVWETPGGYASPQQQAQRQLSAQQEHASGSPFAAGRATQHLGGAFQAPPPAPLAFAGGSSQVSSHPSLNGTSSGPFASYASSSGFAPPGPEAFAAPQPAAQHASHFAANGHAPQQRAPHDGSQSFLNG